MHLDADEIAFTVLIYVLSAIFYYVTFQLHIGCLTICHIIFNAPLICLPILLRQNNSNIRDI